MAFNLQYLGRIDTNMQTGPFPLYKYRSTVDTLAQISAAGYFDDAASFLEIGTLIFCQDNTNVIGIRTVTAVSPQVTTNAFGAVPVVGTANIDDLAVTTAKLADLAVTTGKIANNAVTSAKLALNTIQYAQVVVNNAAFLNASVAPVQIIAAGGANTLIIVESAMVRYLYAAAQSTLGGNLGLQYGNTAAFAGPSATNFITAATLNADTASSNYLLQGASADLASEQINAGIFLSNDTANFASAGGSLVVEVAYRIISTA